MTQDLFDLLEGTFRSEGPSAGFDLLIRRFREEKNFSLVLKRSSTGSGILSSSQGQGTLNLWYCAVRGVMWKLLNRLQDVFEEWRTRRRWKRNHLQSRDGWRR
jgi:hypothetical protein